MFKSIFREYDIRGIYEKDLNEVNVKGIGFCLGKMMRDRGVKTVSVGYDARTSANALFNYLVSGLNFANIDVFDIGIQPTPVGYFTTFNDFFDANIMITGSHNPKEYNGFKITIKKDSFFGQDLQNLYLKTSEFISHKKFILDNFKATKFDALSPYVEFYKKEFSHLNSLKTKIVCDCGNGTAGISLKKIIKALKLDIKILYGTPDGNFPNHHPDPSEEENLIDLKTELSYEFDLGFGFDGDADRIAVLTKKRVIKGDELAYLYAKNMTNPRVLGEVKCSQNMYDEIDKIGKSFMGKTGHSNIKKAMKELNIDLAAEVSGHIFFKERFFGFDDAVYAMFRAIELVQNGLNLDEELDKLPILYSTDEIKIQTTEEGKFKIIQELKKELENGKNDLPKILGIVDIDGVRIQFEQGWALVRASNTVPAIITRFEAKTKEFMELLKEKILHIVESLKARI